MTQHPCPVCSYPLLRHIRSGRLYWFCHHCFQEVLAVEAVATGEPNSESATHPPHSQPDRTVQPQMERALQWLEPAQPTLEASVHKPHPPLVTQKHSTQTLAIARGAAAPNMTQRQQEPGRYGNEIQRLPDARGRKRGSIATQFSESPEAHLRVSLIEVSSFGDVELSKTIHCQSKVMRPQR